MHPALPGIIYRLRWAFGLLLLLAWQPAGAQASNSSKLNPYYLDLRQQLLDASKRTVYVEQVLDGRPGRPPSIGLVYRGLNDKQAPVLFREGLETELTAWLQRQLPSRTTDHPVVLCVRQLHVDEVVHEVGKGSLSSADMVADVYVHLPDGYHFVRNVADYASHTNSGISIIGLIPNHASQLALVLQRCLTQIGDADWGPAARRPARPLAELATAKSPVAYRPAILRAVVPRRGVYLNVAQFLANRPDTTVSLRIDTVSANTLSNVLDSETPTGKDSEWTGTVLLRAKLRTASGDKLPPEEVWGFSDGRHAYLRQLTNYRLLMRQDNFYTFVGGAPVDVAATNRQTSNNLNYLSRGSGLYSYGPAGNTGQPTVYALDLRTGQAAPYSALSRPLRADTAFVYVYRPLGGPAETQRVFLNDHEVGKLKPGQYLELAWSHVERPMRLSVGTAGGPALLAAPSASTANYLKLTNSSSASPWQWMPVKQGEAEVDALEKQR